MYVCREEGCADFHFHCFSYIGMVIHVLSFVPSEWSVQGRACEQSL